MVERNAGVPADRQIEFPIGIHLGDVVEESDGGPDGRRYRSEIGGDRGRRRYGQMRKAASIRDQSDRTEVAWVDFMIVHIYTHVRSCSCTISVQLSNPRSP